jgi:hypothetical protein
MLALALSLGGCALDDPAEPSFEASASDPAVSTRRTPPPPPDPSAIAEEAAFGRWRPAPVAPTPALATAAEDGCRQEEAVGDLPLAVLDARGLGLMTLVFADGSSAVLCRVGFADDRSVEVAVRPIPAAAGSEAPVEGTLGIHDVELVDTATSPRWVAVGRVGDGVPEVAVNFDDATWSRATIGNGWYATWWSGVAEALGIAAVNSRNIVIDSFAP